MCLHARRIQLHFVVFAGQVRIAQSTTHALPHARGTPAVVTFPHRVELAEPFRQVSPGNAGFKHLEHGVDEETIVGGRASRIADLAG